MVDGPVLASFRQYQRRRNYARGTIDKRMSIVRRYVAGVPAWRSVTFREVEAWIDTDLGHLRPGTKRDAVSHVRAFYRWAQREQLVDVDPTALVESVRLPSRLPRPAPDAVIATAIAGATGQVRAMLVIMSVAGLRCCEVASLVWHRVDLEAGRLVVAGKGGRDRVVMVGADVVRELAALDTTAGYVFVGARGRPHTAGRISQIVGDALPDGVTAHQLRHRAATTALELAGGDLLVVRDMLGHASVATTEGYARLAAGRAAAVTAMMTAPVAR